VSEDDRERVSVQTYVPAYQREVWSEEADAWGVSRAEYVRAMVQAGRRSFDLGEDDENPVEPDDPDATPGVDGLEDRILAILEREGPYGWEELVGALTDDLEERLDRALEDLQAGNRVRYSGRGGGYTVVGGGE